MSSTTLLLTDPRTDLEIIDIPAEFETVGTFTALVRCVVHFFARVDKYNKNWKKEHRICVVTDTSVYLTDEDSTITRSSPVGSISKAIVSQDAAGGPPVINLVIPDEYDMRFCIRQGYGYPPLDHLVHILDAIHKFQVGRPLRVENTANDRELKRTLRLAKPQGWQLHVTPAKTRAALAEALALVNQQQGRGRKSTHTNRPSSPQISPSNSDVSRNRSTSGTGEADASHRVRSGTSSRRPPKQVVHAEVQCGMCDCCDDDDGEGSGLRELALDLDAASDPVKALTGLKASTALLQRTINRVQAETYGRI
eukprot:TRINITY_DN21917_c0_g1_i1.p1 TRINITY_DN21917_c0_g1~~TRINITY_DN21917_c0_g1_i1.p1  ORF type:complete len:309 (+),score=49.01 TRINITY_DN21917_c0_g1_i1:40-966(+)